MNFNDFCRFFGDVETCTHIVLKKWGENVYFNGSDTDCWSWKMDEICFYPFDVFCRDFSTIIKRPDDKFNIYGVSYPCNPKFLHYQVVRQGIYDANSVPNNNYRDVHDIYNYLKGEMELRSHDDKFYSSSQCHELSDLNLSVWTLEGSDNGLYQVPHYDTAFFRDKKVYVRDSFKRQWLDLDGFQKWVNTVSELGFPDKNIFIRILPASILECQRISDLFEGHSDLKMEDNPVVRPTSDELKFVLSGLTESVQSGLDNFELLSFLYYGYDYHYTVEEVKADVIYEFDTTKMLSDRTVKVVGSDGLAVVRSYDNGMVWEKPSVAHVIEVGCLYEYGQDEDVEIIYDDTRFVDEGDEVIQELELGLKMIDVNQSKPEMSERDTIVRAFVPKIIKRGVLKYYSDDRIVGIDDEDLRYGEKIHEPAKPGILIEGDESNHQIQEFFSKYGGHVVEPAIREVIRFGKNYLDDHEIIESEMSGQSTSSIFDTTFLDIISKYYGSKFYNVGFKKLELVNIYRNGNVVKNEDGDYIFFEIDITPMLIDRKAFVDGTVEFANDFFRMLSFKQRDSDVFKLNINSDFNIVVSLHFDDRIKLRFHVIDDDDLCDYGRRNLIHVYGDRWGNILDKSYFTKKRMNEEIREWLLNHKFVLDNEKNSIRARLNEWWVSQIKYPIEVPKANQWIVYVGYFPETKTLKIGRTEDWGSRLSNYMTIQSSIKRGSGLMVLRDYVYVNRYGDAAIDEYLYRCAEKLLKNLADQFPFFENLYSESGRVLEYYDVKDESKISDFIDIFKMTFNGITAQEIRKVRPKYHETQFANQKSKDGILIYNPSAFSEALDNLK